MPSIRNYEGGVIDSAHFFTNILNEKCLLLPDPHLGQSLPFFSIRNFEDLETYIRSGGHLHGIIGHLETLGFENVKSELQRQTDSMFAFDSAVRIFKFERKFCLIHGTSFSFFNSQQDLLRSQGLSFCEGCRKYVMPTQVLYRDFQNHSGQVLCVRCENLASECESCSDNFLTSSMRTISNLPGHHCQDCASNYHYCDNCEEYHAERSCPNADLTKIQEHGFAPAIVPHGALGSSKFPFYIGMELELITSEPQQALRDVRAKYGDLFWGVYDGSVDGIEFVSHPATIEYWKNFNFTPHVSLRGGDAGIHLHACRSGFTHDQIMIMLKLFSQNKPFIKEVAERDERLDQWARIQPWEDYTHRATNLQSWKGGDKYSAINFCHSKTLEFRIFKTSTKTEKIHKNIEFIGSLWDWSKNGDIAGAPTLESYKTFLKKSEYPSLKNFLNLV